MFGLLKWWWCQLKRELPKSYAAVLLTPSLDLSFFCQSSRNAINTVQRFLVLAMERERERERERRRGEREREERRDSICHMLIVHPCCTSRLIWHAKIRTNISQKVFFLSFFIRPWGLCSRVNRTMDDRSLLLPV